jgi:SAM-dependent methyltransferase
MTPSRWDHVLEHYEVLEPGEADSWTPVRNHFELSFRLCLLFALTRALEQTAVPPASLRVLDVGCGNGRSSRLYLELGLSPAQITGVDLRRGALELARRLHPSIGYLLQEGDTLPVVAESANWVSLVTVASSLEARLRGPLFDDVRRALAPGGHIFYFDLWRANGFAGGGRIRPEQHLRGLRTLWRRTYRSYQFVPLRETARYVLGEALRRRGRIRGAGLSLGQLLLRPSHEVLLLQVPGR